MRERERETKRYDEDRDMREIREIEDMEREREERD